MNRFRSGVARHARRIPSPFAAFAILLVGCGSPAEAPPDPEVATVVVLPDDEPLVSMGQDLQLSVRVTTTAGGTLADPSVAWSTDDAGVLTVTNDGLMTGQSDGSATVTATVEGHTGSQAFRGDRNPARAPVALGRMAGGGRSGPRPPVEEAPWYSGRIGSTR